MYPGDTELFEMVLALNSSLYELQSVQVVLIDDKKSINYEAHKHKGIHAKEVFNRAYIKLKLFDEDSDGLNVEECTQIYRVVKEHNKPYVDEINIQDQFREYHIENDGSLTVVPVKSVFSVRDYFINYENDAVSDKTVLSKGFIKKVLSTFKKMFTR